MTNLVPFSDELFNLPALDPVLGCTLAAFVKSFEPPHSTAFTSAANGFGLSTERPLHDVPLVEMLSERCQISSACGTGAELRGRAAGWINAEDVSPKIPHRGNSPHGSPKGTALEAASRSVLSGRQDA